MTGQQLVVGKICGSLPETAAAACVEGVRRVALEWQARRGVNSFVLFKSIEGALEEQTTDQYLTRLGYSDVNSFTSSCGVMPPGALHRSGLVWLELTWSSRELGSSTVIVEACHCEAVLPLSSGVDPFQDACRSHVGR